MTRAAWWAAWLLIVVFSGGPSLADSLVQHDGCGALCKRTCCKPSDCTTLRGRCCCTDQAPAGPAPPSRDAAVVAGPVRLADDTSATRVAPPAVVAPDDLSPGRDDPPPRTRLS